MNVFRKTQQNVSFYTSQRELLLTNSSDQHTFTDKYRTARWNYNAASANRIAPRVHYRMALVEVGYPLKYLTGTKELLHATYTAFIGTCIRDTIYV